VGALLIHLCKRAEALGLKRNGGVQFPLTQQHIADALGLSLVHTNKSMRKLSKLGLFEIKDGALELKNGHAVAKLAQLFDEEPARRPLL